MSAAKQNGSKSRGIQSIWSISLIHEGYARGMDEDLLPTSRMFAKWVILLLRAATGWRSGDVANIFIDNGVTVQRDPVGDMPAGVYLRSYNNKTNKNGWTERIFIPKLADEFRSHCVATLVNSLAKYTKHLDPWKKEIKDINGNKVADTPLFTVVGKGSQNLQAAPATLAKYFRMFFLERMDDPLEPSKTLSNRFQPHSCRNAVASALASFNVPHSLIATHCATTFASLSKTYICTIEQPLQVPHECVKAQPFLSAKLLTPFIHKTTFSEETKACQCSNLVSFKSSIEEPEWLKRKLR
jgi:hypothetical protein